MNVLKYILVLITTSAAAFYGYYHGEGMAEQEIDQDKQELLDKVNELFGDQKTICDGVKKPLSGPLDDITYFGGETGLYRIEEGGFEVYELSKKYDGYVKKVIRPILYGFEYLMAEKEWVSAPSGFSGGYWNSNYLPSESQCYINSYEVLLFGSEVQPKDFYKPDSYDEIRAFPEGFKSKYYQIEGSSVQDSDFDYQQTGSLSTNKWKLQYAEQLSYYELIGTNYGARKTLLQKMAMKYGAIYGGIILAMGVLIIVVLLLLKKQRKPKSKSEKKITETKWRNIETGAIITIVRNGKKTHTVTLVENDVPTKGTASFEDNGRTLQLSFDNRELFYQVMLLEKDRLELLDLAKNTVSKFERLGSNSHSI